MMRQKVITFTATGLGAAFAVEAETLCATNSTAPSKLIGTFNLRQIYPQAFSPTSLADSI